MAKLPEIQPRGAVMRGAQSSVSADRDTFVDLNDGLGERRLSDVLAEADEQIVAAMWMEAYVEGTVQ